MNPKVTNSIPSQGMYLGCRPGPQLRACERQPIIVSLAQFLSLSFSLLSCLFKNKQTKSFKNSIAGDFRILTIILLECFRNHSHSAKFRLISIYSTSASSHFPKGILHLLLGEKSGLITSYILIYSSLCNSFSELGAL